MRRAPKTLSRLNAASLIAALLVFGIVPCTAAVAMPPSPGQDPGKFPLLSAPGASGQDSVAYAVPRNAPSPDVEIVLPQNLPPSAVAQYQRILQLQASGDYTGADRVIARLDDTSLLGPVLAARYLSPDYRSTSSELVNWCQTYDGEPEAPAVYALMRRKLPRGTSAPAAPQINLLPEATITAGAASRPVAQPDSHGWHVTFMTALARWQRGDIAGAGPIFMRAANMNVSDDDRAAGAFWSARAALRLQQPGAYLDWLRIAASAPDTFYGILAGRLLGQGFGPTGIAATLTEADIIAVDATADGHLAFALLQLGQTDAAATALRALWPQIQTNPDLGRSVMAVAARAGLVDVTIAMAGQVSSPVDDIAGAYLPLPALHPSGGFSVDPALVYALARTESGFNINATSRAGARGLMQLMPVTASYIGRNAGIHGAVSDPSANLALGQAYLKYLGDQNGISNNLLAILASYNAGPGAAAAWYSSLRDDSDPLAFIETIPNDETRRFVRQVLADSWIYAEEIGMQPTSLNDLAEGNFPQLGLNLVTAAAN